MKIIEKPTVEQRPDWAPVYIDKVPKGGRVLVTLAEGLETLMRLTEPLTNEEWEYRYAPGKWTIKETLVHLMDAERVFTYRALAAARGDTTSLPGFDHNAYVPASDANARTGADIQREYRALRTATLAFFEHLTAEQLDRVGEANGQPASARAMVYMIAGHERHHLQLLRERYLNQ